jgi:5'-3' exonuclease
MAYCLIEELKRLNNPDIEYIVAPYEADAELAYLGQTGYIHAVITEDSDLVPYGTPRVGVFWACCSLFRFTFPSHVRAFLYGCVCLVTYVVCVLCTLRCVFLCVCFSLCFSLCLCLCLCLSVQVFYKMNRTGEGEEVELCKLGDMPEPMSFADWSLDMFRHVCILSGCDYLDSLDGVGLKTAYLLYKRCGKDVEKVHLSP